MPSRESTAQQAVRRINFEYPDRPLLCWTPRIPEVSAAANSVSLMMPFVEPYVARSVRSAIPDLEPPLAQRAKWFIDQEISHQRQHKRFNEILRREVPVLARAERMMRWTFRRLESRRSREFSLAFAAGAETVAYSIARWSDKHASELFVDADPVITTLFMWHLAEEVEHKSVAFDVHSALGGSRWKYLLGAICSLMILAFFTVASSLVMLRAQRRLKSPLSWFRLTRWALSLCFEVLPNVFAAATRSHHPDLMADPVGLVAWLRLYDADSESIPLWWRPSSQPV